MERPPGNSSLHLMDVQTRKYEHNKLKPTAKQSPEKRQTCQGGQAAASVFKRKSGPHLPQKIKSMKSAQALVVWASLWALCGLRGVQAQTFPSVQASPHGLPQFARNARLHRPASLSTPIVCSCALQGTSVELLAGQPARFVVYNATCTGYQACPEALLVILQNVAEVDANGNAIPGRDAATMLSKEGGWQVASGASFGQPPTVGSAANFTMQLQTRLPSCPQPAPEKVITRRGNVTLEVIMPGADTNYTLAPGVAPIELLAGNVKFNVHVAAW